MGYTIFPYKTPKIVFFSFDIIIIVHNKFLILEGDNFITIFINFSQQPVFFCKCLTIIKGPNVVVFDRRNGVNLKGRYFIKDSMYIVPDDMLHFVIKKDGEIIFFEDDCIIEKGKIGRDEVVTKSGIILPDVRDRIEKKHDLMEGVVYAKSAHMHDVEIGDMVRLADHSDYEIEFPDGEVRWFVQYKDVLYKYE